MGGMEAAMGAEVEPDLRFEDHGTVALLVPISEPGRQWIADNCEVPDWARHGGSVAVEPRCVPAIVRGAADDGLVVELC